MYSLPQEIEVWYIIPKIRKELAGIFVKEYGLSYEKAGDILGISKAAVSQYLSNKRANKIKLSKETEKEIKISAKNIIEKKTNGMIEIERIIQFMKKSKCACDVCKQYNKGVLKYCNCEYKY
jgi:predicted transcriptional regulator